MSNGNTLSPSVPEFALRLREGAWQGYHPDTLVLRDLKLLEASQGKDEVAALCRDITRHLVEMTHKASLDWVPGPMRLYIEPTLAHVRQEIDKRPDKYFNFENDRFVKTLAQACLRLINCEVELVDIHSGVPRRVAFAHGAAQFMKYARTIGLPIAASGRWYESHWDRRLSTRFDQAAYEQFYELIRTCVLEDKSAQGYATTSWWFDPSLETISPDLDFLSSPTQYGAIKLFVGRQSSTRKDALAFSAARQQAFDDGRYVPTDFFLAWPRSKM